MKLNGTICLTICACLTLAPDASAQNFDSWTGEWISDKGVLSLEQDGSTVKGDYGNSGTVTGKADDKTLNLSYKDENFSGKVEFTMSADGRSFEAEWKSRNNDTQVWRGWRKDPDAEDAEQADFSGYWMTTWGPMQIEQDGDTVTGTYAAHGWSSFEGTVTGRRMNFDWKKLHWSGNAWLEMSKDGSRVFGATKAEQASTWLGIRVPDHTYHVEPVAGEIVKGYADNGMMYHLRMPDDWKKGEPVDVIVLLHGSNWTTAGMVYITNENWPEIGKKFAILGIQGERWVKYSDADSPRFNYTYVNWVGRSTLGGFPYTDRESPWLVSNVIDELDEIHDFDRVFVGGHSQGGFLTYLMHMHFPEKIAGTFPIAGGLINQSEPSVFDDMALIEAQQQTPMAIVHGKKDRAVPFSTGQRAYGAFLNYGFPNVTFITPNSGHPYDFLPINEAIEYLDMMTTKDADALTVYATRMVEAKNWRVVRNLIQHAKEIDAGKSFSAIWQAHEAAAKKDANQLKRKILANNNSDWVDEYMEWSEHFAGSKAGEEAEMAFDILRSEHDPPAAKLMKEAREAFNNGKSQVGWAKYGEIAEKYWASKVFSEVIRAIKRR